MRFDALRPIAEESSHFADGFFRQADTDVVAPFSKDRGRIATGFSDLTSCSEQTYTDLHDQVVYHQTTREPKRPGAWNEKSVSPYRSETAP